MAELVDSITEVGLLQPVVVRPLGDDRFELVMGERRWRATQAAGLAVIPAIVRETKDHDLLRDALLENLHRAQLNPLEEAAAYQQLLTDFGCTQDELATRIKRSRPQISNTLRLLRLPPTVQRRVAAGVLSAGHARALLAVADTAGQERLAQRVVAEGLSVRTIEEMVALGETGDRHLAPRRTARKVPAPGGRRRGRPTVRPAGHPGPGRPRPAPRPDHHRLRLGRGPGADRPVDRAEVDKSTFSRRTTTRRDGHVLRLRLLRQLGPDVPGGRPLCHEGQERDRAGQRDQEQPRPAPLGPKSQVDRGDQQHHVEIAVRDSGPCHDLGDSEEVFEGQPDQHQHDQQGPDQVGHDPVPDPGVAHEHEPMR